MMIQPSLLEAPRRDSIYITKITLFSAKKGEENERSVLFLNERDPLSLIDQGSCDTSLVICLLSCDRVLREVSRY